MQLLLLVWREDLTWPNYDGFRDTAVDGVDNVDVVYIAHNIAVGGY